MLTFPTRRSARAAAVALGGVLAALTLPALAHADEIPVPKDNGMLAFTEKTGSSNLSYVIWPDGTHQRQADVDNDFDRGIVGGWSPDGHTLLVLDTYMGDQVNPLSQGSGGGSFGWSWMDDDYQAIGEMGNGDWSPNQQYRVWGSTNGLRKQTGPSPAEFVSHTEARDPQWANNDRLVWTSPTEGVMAIDGASSSTTIRTLVAGTGFEHATVSVDGTKIAYSEHDGTSWNVRVMTVDGGTGPANLETGTDGSDERYATMSPDGKQVAFVSDRSGKPAIWIAPVDGSSAAKMVPNTERAGAAELAGLSWQPGLKPTMLPTRFQDYPTYKVGDQLYANYGGHMEATPDYEVAYKWEMCSIRRSDAGQCYDTGQTGSSYTFTQADRGFKIKYTRTTTNALGSASTSIMTSWYGDPPATTTGRPTLTSSTAPIAGTSTKVTWTGAEPGGWFVCSTDYRVTWNECESGIELTGLKNGYSFLYVMQKNDWGMGGQELYVEIYSDQEKPYAPGIWNYPNYWTGPTMDGVFEWGGENKPGNRFECQEDSGAWATCTTPHTMSVTTEGQHTFRVREVDAVGNVGDVATKSWTATKPPVAAVPPAAPTLVSGPPALTNSTNVSIDFTGADPEGTGFSCRLNGGPWGGACGPAFTRTSMAPGTHTFEVRQLGKTGLEGEILTVTWTVDTTKPGLPVMQEQPLGTLTVPTARFAFTTEAGARSECRVDGGAWAACASPYELAGLTNGSHTVGIRQIDAAGNVGNARNITWTVQAPSGMVAEPTVEAPAPAAPVTAPVAPATPATAPAATAPKATAAAPAPAATKPTITADLGGSGSGTGTGATGTPTITVSGDGLGVGCAAAGATLTSCTVNLYAAAATGATARAAAAAKVLVGTGRAKVDARSKRTTVDVKLNATGRALLRRSPGGLKVSVAISGRQASGTALKATGVATLVARQVRATVGGFAVDHAELPTAAKRQLARLARQVKGTAATIRVTGHTDGSTTDSAYLKRLGARRAAAVARYLRAHGVQAKATVVSRGADAPRATNATRAGRALNRRVELRIER